MKRTFTKYPSSYVKADTAGKKVTRGELAKIIYEKLSKDWYKQITTEDMMDYIKSIGISATYNEVTDAMDVAKSWERR